MLNKAEYKQVFAKIRKLQAASPSWNATVYNCNAFVGEIARSMGYKAPSKCPGRRILCHPTGGQGHSEAARGSAEGRRGRAF